MAEQTENYGAVLGICNPLLDISVNAEDDLFKKFEIQPGLAGLAQPHHEPYYDEIAQRPDAEFIAGGAGQNSIRAVSWMLQQPGVGHYTGAVGDDETARKLKTIAERDGVVTHYYVANGHRTGSCAVLIKDKERALLANLAAANHYKLHHFETESMKHALERAKIFYATGFFLTVEPEALVHMGKKAHEQDKIFVMNVSAPFLVDFFWDKMQAVIPYTDFIVANETEAAAYAKKAGWNESDLREAAMKLAESPKINSRRPRTVVFTQGSKSTLVYHNGEVKEFDVPAVPSEEIVDTNGAGDAFVGGLLAGLVKGAPLEKAVAAGHNLAGHVIRRSGMTFPAQPDFKWD